MADEKDPVSAVIGGVAEGIGGIIGGVVGGLTSLVVTTVSEGYKAVDSLTDGLPLTVFESIMEGTTKDKG
jgi:hypothetical protein